MFDPLHLLEVQDFDLVAEVLALAFLEAVVTAEEDEEGLMKHARLLFQLSGVALGEGGGGVPLGVRNVERVVVFQDAVVVSSVDEDFVAVGLHAVEGPPIRHNFLEMRPLEAAIHADQ